MRATETARGITALLPYGFDVDLGRIDHPELEEKLSRLIFSLPTLPQGWGICRLTFANPH